MSGSTIQVWTSVVPAAAAPSPALPLAAPANPAFAAADWGSPSELGKVGFYKINTSELSLNLKRTVGALQEVMDDLPKSPSGYSIEEVELHMVITGKGGIALIGKLEVGVAGGIKVKIKRKS
jgi:hypothetical protein